MTQRTTDEHVKSAFASMVSAAQSVGFDTTGWALHWGNGSYGYQFRVTDNVKGTNVTRDLGSTRREAWEALYHYADAYWNVNILLESVQS